MILILLNLLKIKKENAIYEIDNEIYIINEELEKYRDLKINLDGFSKFQLD